MICNEMWQNSGVVDSSGIRFYVTSKPRQYDSGIMELGLEYTNKMAIPPRQNRFLLTGYCVPECTAIVSAHVLHLYRNLKTNRLIFQLRHFGSHSLAKGTNRQFFQYSLLECPSNMIRHIMKNLFFNSSNFSSMRFKRLLPKRPYNNFKSKLNAKSIF